MEGKTLQQHLDETANRLYKFEKFNDCLHSIGRPQIVEIMMEAAEAYAQESCDNADPWISIDKELPEIEDHGDELISTTVVVTDGEYQDYGHVENSGKWKCYGMFLNPKCITHWKRKPALPKTCPLATEGDKKEK